MLYKIIVTIDESVLSIDDIEANIHTQNTLEWAGYNVVDIDIKEMNNGRERISNE